MIKHHVKEEEKPGGMFAEARKSDMDLRQVGSTLKSRKSELEADGQLGSTAVAGVTTPSWTPRRVFRGA